MISKTKTSVYTSARLTHTEAEYINFTMHNIQRLARHTFESKQTVKFICFIIF